MVKLILRIFSRNNLWKAIMDKEGFGTTESAANYSIWTDVFRKSPDLVEFLKRREISLLKALTLEEKSKDFILGQIYENRMWQRYDVPNNDVPKVEIQVEEKIVNKEKFLNIWKHGSKVKNSEAQDSKVQVAEGKH